MKFRVYFTLIITASLLYACSGIQLHDYPSESCAKLPGDAAVNVIKARCSLCHKGDFKTKESICARKKIIKDSVVEGRMPKFGKLKEKELQTLLKWDF